MIRRAFALNFHKRLFAHTCTDTQTWRESFIPSQKQKKIRKENLVFPNIVAFAVLHLVDECHIEKRDPPSRAQAAVDVR